MNLPVKISKTAYVIGLLLLVIFILLAIIILRNPKIIHDVDKEKELRDSLVVLKSNIDNSNLIQANIQRKYDSLRAIEPQVIHANHEKTKFIFNTASPFQLDSIIRSSWNKRHY